MTSVESKSDEERADAQLRAGLLAMDEIDALLDLFEAHGDKADTAGASAEIRTHTRTHTHIVQASF